jgi:hypothetical protein
MAGGQLSITVPGDLTAERMTTSADVTLVAGGTLIDVGAIGFGGESDTILHRMDTRHVNYLRSKDVTFDPATVGDGSVQAPDTVTLSVLSGDGRILLGKAYVRSRIAAFAAHSRAGYVYAASPEKTLKVELTSVKPQERMVDADWTFGEAAEISFTKYWTKFGRVESEAEVLHFEDAWTQRSDITNAWTYVISENSLRTIQGGDVQIYSLNERFILDMLGRETFTDAYYINYRGQRLVENWFRDEDSLVREGRKENAQHLRLREEERSWERASRYDDSIPASETGDAGTGTLIRWEDAVYKLQPLTMND